jgi:hypothetical protein
VHRAVCADLPEAWGNLGWQATADGGKMCELDADIVRDIFDRCYSSGEIKKLSIAKKMVRAARGVGYTSAVGFEVEDKINKTDELSGGRGADDAEVLVDRWTLGPGDWEFM